MARATKHLNTNALWADVGVRRSIIALALLIWSGMTALTGFAQSFVHLALVWLRQ